MEVSPPLTFRWFRLVGRGGLQADTCSSSAMVAAETKTETVVTAAETKTETETETETEVESKQEKHTLSEDATVEVSTL